MQKRIVLLASLLAVLCLLGAILISSFSGDQYASILVYGAGTPDAYGNRIGEFFVHNNATETGEWVTVTSVHYTDYTNGKEVSIPAEHTILSLVVLLNDTFAANASQAIAYTRVFITIDGVVEGELMTQSGTPTDLAGFWIVTFYWPSPTSAPTTTWLPTEDTTYVMGLEYQVFYLD